MAADIAQAKKFWLPQTQTLRHIVQTFLTHAVYTERALYGSGIQQFNADHILIL